MGIKLRPYQDKTYQEIISKIEEGYSRILVQAETGWGKSILIGHITNNLEGRTLILTHRQELLKQNSEWIEELGVLTASVKKAKALRYNKNVIAMVETAYSRFNKYGYDYLGEFDNIIIDEVHVDFFKKIWENVPFKLLIGLTATPIIYKTEKKEISPEEVLTRKITLADDYEVLVQGIGVQELIALGYLTQDKYIVLQPDNIDKLRRSKSNPDGFTSNSLTEVFGSRTSIKKVLEAYQIRESTKTIIFNPTTKVNKRLFEAFKKEGYENVRMYDSVNKSKEETREEVVNWFKNTDDAILLNVGVFTTGFNVKDISTIIYNKSTISLSLWLQSCGRGSRIHPNKKEFYIIDLGLNVERHGFWSKDRDWSKEFRVHEWKSRKPTDLLLIWECESCGAYNQKGTVFNEETKNYHCGSCGEERKERKSSKKYINGKFVEIDPVGYPKSKNIIQYCKENGNDANLAFKLAEQQIIDLVTSRTKSEFYHENRERCKARIREIYRPIYFTIIKSDLVGARKKLETQVLRIMNKLDKYYGETKLVRAESC